MEPAPAWRSTSSSRSRPTRRWGCPSGPAPTVSRGKAAPSQGGGDLLPSQRAGAQASRRVAAGVDDGGGLAIAPAAVDHDPERVVERGAHRDGIEEGRLPVAVGAGDGEGAHRGTQ